MSIPENLYFAAIIPPESVRDEITGFKKDIAERFASKAALKVIPHITLKAPFKLDATRNDDVVDWFESITLTVTPFQVDLIDFGSFEKKSVIYIAPVLTTELQTLQQEILKSFRSSFPEVVVMDPDFRYKPHITIGYRDWPSEKYEEAWKEYGFMNYKASFAVQDIQLMLHDGRKWNRICTRAL
jgi:2'-5' RNA ligase